MSRTVVVDAARLTRWAAGFEERHGSPVTVTPDGPDLVLTAPDGELARFVFPAPAVLGATVPDPTVPDPTVPARDETFTDVESFARAVLEPRRTAVVLARRGGYACAVVEGERVEVSKVGTRYVQGRTAAGGWSQQRFARRRANQTDELVGACTEHAVRLLVPSGAALVATGGDRTLCDRVLADPRLKPIGALPRGQHLAVGDPRADVVKSVPQLLRQVSIVIDAPEDP